MRFLQHCRHMGAGGIQATPASLDKRHPAETREKAGEYGMYVEVSARLPSNNSDGLEVSEKTVRATNAAGGSAIRTVMLCGRRYETFNALDDTKEFSQQSRKSLTRAEPIHRRHGMRLAIENHTDLRIHEMLSSPRRIVSGAVGVTIDSCNSMSLMSLLADPVETARAFALYANSVHLKVMRLQSCEDGFLLAEVPFGEGCLDITAVVDPIRAQRAEVRFTLDMITRDPLRVPFPRRNGSKSRRETIARAWSTVRSDWGSRRV